MPDPVELPIPFPIGGFVNSAGFAGQPEKTTASVLNVWPRNYPGGRARGGVRPGVSSVTAPGGTPHNWCPVEWSGGRGVGVVTSSGTHSTENGTSWSTLIGTNPGSSVTGPSCTNYKDTVYQASEGATNGIIPFKVLGGAGGTLTARLDADDKPLGVVPTYCGLVATHGNRLAFAGDKNNRHVLYMSRVDDPQDYDYSAVDQGAAWANSGGGEGRFGEPITSLISHNRVCLLVGCTDSTYVVRGNPRISGSIEILSHQVGPLMQSAWCKTGSEDTIMMTREGVFLMPPGCGQPPINVSDAYIPDDLVGLDADNDVVSLAWDGRFRGVHIYVNKASGTDFAYFFVPPERDSVLPGSFWPMDFTAFTPQLGVNLKAAASPTKSGMILLGATGSRQYNTSSKESIEAHLMYGPIPMGSPGTEGILARISAVLSESSDPVSWEIYSGDSAQEAFAGIATFTGSEWSRKGFNYWQHPRVRGNSFYLKVFSTGSNRWSIEEIIGEASLKNRRRVG